MTASGLGPAASPPGQSVSNTGIEAPAGYPLEHDVLTLVLLALFIQVVLPYRHDWAAHLLGGGGLMLLVAASVPRSLWRFAAPVGYLTVLVLAGVGEQTTFGPPDLVDIAYTLGGAVVAYQASTTVGASRGSARGRAAAWGAAIVVIAVFYRYASATGRT